MAKYMDMSFLVEVPDSMTLDAFVDEFIEWLNSKEYSAAGKTIEVDEEGNQIERKEEEFHTILSLV